MQNILNPLGFRTLVLKGFFFCAILLFALPITQASAGLADMITPRLTETFFRLAIGKTAEGQLIAERLIGRHFSMASTEDTEALLLALRAPENKAFAKELFTRLERANTETLIRHLEMDNGLNFTSVAAEVTSAELALAKNQKKTTIEFLKGPRIKIGSYAAMRKKFLE